MRKKFFKNLEWSIVIVTILLVIIGLFAIYSAAASTDEYEFHRQLMWTAIAIPITALVMFVDYKFWAKLSPIFYGIVLLSLGAVLFTSARNGASSWFQIGDILIQPSEFAKIAVILLLAFLISKMRKRSEDEMSRPTRIILLLIIFAIPTALIVLQPDYGTAAAFIMAFALILFTSGIKKRWIIITVIIVAVAVPLLYTYVLPEHAKARIQTFMNPESDPRGAGYNIAQSKLAIGSGQLLGMGYMKGNQTQLGYLYPKTSDFIFSVIGEEMGFVVAGGIIILYVILITKALTVAKTAKDSLGTAIASGIAGIFLFHMIENIGMTMGLLPITGVPLPFVSYGGSSLISNFIMIGLLLNISGRRQKNLFEEE